MHIQGSFNIDNDDKILGYGQFAIGSVHDSFNNLGANDDSVGFSRRTVAHGLFFAPNGNLNLGNETDLFGQFWAKTIGSDFDANVTLERWNTPEPQSLVLLATGLLGLVAFRRRRSG